MKLNFLLLALIVFAGCTIPKKEPVSKIRVVFDTDTNNELDDQHALAYLIFNQAAFTIEAITINTTSSGGNIDLQYAEARRVLQLCNADTIPVLKGADKSFQQIISSIDSSSFDGHAAVERIIQEAHKPAVEKLVVLAVGKLTNVALAVAKDSSIVNRIRLVWLGSNYPEPGEHNQNNDTIAMNYLLNTNMDFEMVTVRYGKSTGTSVVTITKKEVGEVMPGLGPRITTPVTGRHGGEFYCFGDYSVNLFDHIDYHGDPPARSLFDMAAVAIVKNPEWAKVTSHPAPLFVNGAWIERPNNTRQIKVWENFNRDAIVGDFIRSLKEE